MTESRRDSCARLVSHVTYTAGGDALPGVQKQSRLQSTLYAESRHAAAAPPYRETFQSHRNHEGGARGHLLRQQVLSSIT
jgi:hypothetical protein